MLDVSLSPRTCSCPNTTYTCEVNDATDIRWKTSTTGDTDMFYYDVNSDTSYREDNSFQVKFTYMYEEEDDTKFNFTSTLKVTDLDQNETNLTCEGIIGRSAISNTTQICIVGITTHKLHQYCLFSVLFSVLYR